MEPRLWWWRGLVQGLPDPPVDLLGRSEVMTVRQVRCRSDGGWSAAIDGR